MVTKKIASGLKRNVVPDRIDLRDRPYQPTVAVIPGATLEPKTDIPELFQGDSNACTGFSLASVIYHLQHVAKRSPAQCGVSPFMLYSMARRYDEFPGDPSADTGSSLRGAMKGWYKHGACASKLWTTEPMPSTPVKKTSDDWWLVPYYPAGRHPPPRICAETQNCKCGKTVPTPAPIPRSQEKATPAISVATVPATASDARSACAPWRRNNTTRHTKRSGTMAPMPPCE